MVDEVMRLSNLLKSFLYATSTNYLKLPRILYERYQPITIHSKRGQALKRAGRIYLYERYHPMYDSFQESSDPQMGWAYIYARSENHVKFWLLTQVLLRQWPETDYFKGGYLYGSLFR